MKTSNLKFALALVSLFVLPAAAQANVEIAKKCARQGEDFIRPDRYIGFAMNLADETGLLAKYDANCDGKLSKEEQERYEQDLRIKASSYVAALKAKDPESRGIAIERASLDFGLKKPSTWQPPFMIRDAYSPFTILNPPKPREKAEGALISYTHDFQNRNDIISATGALIGYSVLNLEPKPGQPYSATRVALSPAMEFDWSHNRKTPSKDKNYLAFRFIGETEVEGRGLFPLQYFRLSPYLKTDFDFDSQIVGGFAQWEPYNLDLAIGVSRLIPGTPIQFRWQPILHAEYERVSDPGRVPGLVAGAEHLRVGPILQANWWFNTGPFQALVLDAQYRHLWDQLGGPGTKNIGYFQFAAAYNLDEAGNIAWSAKYRNGNSPGDGAKVHDFKTGLTMKY